MVRYTPATEREIQWTFQQVREPKYSVDGDGACIYHALHLLEAVL
jgi:hypothetical protein